MEYQTLFSLRNYHNLFALNAITKTAADGNFCDIFLNFEKKLGMIFRENGLPADVSHEIFLICNF